MKGQRRVAADFPSMNLSIFREMQVAKKIVCVRNLKQAPRKIFDHLTPPPFMARILSGNSIGSSWMRGCLGYLNKFVY